MMLFFTILILGARCNDGVVIVTDMKITSLATGTPEFLRYESKISGVFTNIILVMLVMRTCKKSTLAMQLAPVCKKGMTQMTSILLITLFTSFMKI
jgi:hypothetical protein